jgi:hypothetical protein
MSPTTASSRSSGRRPALVSFLAILLATSAMTVGAAVAAAQEEGSIIIDKVTEPAGDPTAFTFLPTWGASFELTDESEPADSGPLTPGAYSVAETVSGGWTLSDQSCSDGSDPSAIVLDPGETVTCTFTNVREGDEEDEVREQDLALAPIVPVEGYFDALLDRRINDLAGYVCGATSWHSLLGSPAFGIDPEEWWPVLKFKSPKGLTYELKSRKKPSGATGKDSLSSDEKVKLLRDLKEGGKPSGETGKDGLSSDEKVELFDELFDKGKPSGETGKDGLSSDEKVELFDKLFGYDKPSGETGKTGLSGDDKVELYDRLFDDGKPSGETGKTGLSGEEKTELFDKLFDELFKDLDDGSSIEEVAVVRVKGAVTIGVKDKPGVKRLIRKSLRERFGKTPDKLMLDLAVDELAKGQRMSLTQNVPVAKVDGRWLICN